MTEVSLLRLCDAQAQLIDELIGDRTDAFGSDAVEALARSIPLWIEVCDTASQGLDSLRTAFFLGSIKKYQPIGVVARTFLPRMVRILERLRRRGRQARDAGLPTTKLDELEAAIGRFRRSNEEFLLRWPWGDPDRLAGALAAFERGETVSAKEFLNELLDRAGPGSPVENAGMELIPPTHP